VAPLVVAVEIYHLLWPPALDPRPLPDDVVDRAFWPLLGIGLAVALTVFTVLARHYWKDS